MEKQIELKPYNTYDDNLDKEQWGPQYAAALRFLEDCTKFGINLGLGRIERLLQLMDEPHKAGVKYLHIGGTNGKGSVSAFLSAILRVAEQKCALFSSPHLHSYRERYRINGEMISRSKLVAQIERIKPLLAQMQAEGAEQPTEFEVSTALALRYFSDSCVDYAVMEVGMGGEIDSTNVILPELSVITNVAMDHMDYLGHNPAEIATVKSGIIKEGRPAFTAAADAEVLAVLADKAAAVGAPLYVLGRDFAVADAVHDEVGQTFTFCDLRRGMELPDLQINLLGAHQLNNAALAVAAALELGIDVAAIYAGLSAARWPGRLEVISDEPLIVLDGAHNTAGMQALSAAIREYWPNKKIVAVLGMLADKERREALQNLLPLLDKAVICRVPSYRAGDWESLGEVCVEFGVPYELVEEVSAAVDAGMVLAAEENADMLLISGSLYMLADARAHLLGVAADE